MERRLDQERPHLCARRARECISDHTHDDIGDSFCGLQNDVPCEAVCSDYIDIARTRVALAAAGMLATRPMDRPIYQPPAPVLSSVSRA